MINIQGVPDEFLSSNIIPYPIHNKSYNVEKLFLDAFKKNKKYSSDLTYLPVQWTNYLVRNNYGKNISSLQNYCNKLDDNKKYFTIVQYAGGPIVELDNCIVFSSGGIFNTPPSQNLSYIPIPLITDKHVSLIKRKRRFKIGYIGRNTHDVRVNLEKILSKNSTNKIINIKSDGILQKDSRHFKKLLTQSIFSLCPRGFGPTSFRLYESIQLGAIPIYVSDKFHLPYKNFIDWEKLCLLIDINEIDKIQLKVDSLLESKKYIEMQNYGKYCQENYFNNEFIIKNIFDEVSKF